MVKQETDIPYEFPLKLAVLMAVNSAQVVLMDSSVTFSPQKLLIRYWALNAGIVHRMGQMVA